MFTVLSRLINDDLTHEYDPNETVTSDSVRVKIDNVTLIRDDGSKLQIMTCGF